LASYLSKPNRRYVPLATSPPAKLAAVLRPADVLLVEGSTRFSTAIKYLTQSTWSHAALYVGPIPGLADEGSGEPPALVEADVVHGVRAIPLSAYAEMHTRICRPVGLSDDDRRKVVAFAIASIGKSYDLKNIVDLARYLLPTPPVPTRWRRRMLSLGSGEPTKAICRCNAMGVPSMAPSRERGKTSCTMRDAGCCSRCSSCARAKCSRARSKGMLGSRRATVTAPRPLPRPTMSRVSLSPVFRQELAGP
jgi:hypothetical protein